MDVKKAVAGVNAATLTMLSSTDQWLEDPDLDVTMEISEVNVVITVTADGIKTDFSYKSRPIGQGGEYNI